MPPSMMTATVCPTDSADALLEVLKEPHALASPGSPHYRSANAHRDRRAACYTPSLRPIPDRVPPLDYPDRFDTRYASANGGIRCNSH
jgi:hypothetical protein